MTFIAFYKGKKITVQAASSRDAQLDAAKQFKARKVWDVAVVHADEPVNPARLG